MNSLLSILFIILLTILTLPVYTPKGIYLNYQVKKKKINDVKKLKKCKICLRASSILPLLIYGIVLIYFIFFNLHLLDIMLYFFTGIIFKIVLYFLYDSFIPIDIPEKIKKFNLVFNLIVCTFFAIIGITGTVSYHRVQNSITENVPNIIENYANNNDYIIFPQKLTKLTDSSGTTTSLLNNTKTHYFILDGTNKDESNTIIVYDRRNPSKSFEVMYDKLFEFNKRSFEKEYAHILDNFYLGANYAPICYLVNENDFLLIYELIEKDEKRNEFYVSTYVIFDMVTGEYSEL